MESKIKEILIKYDYQHRLDLELLAELESYISSHYIAKEKVKRLLVKTKWIDNPNGEVNIYTRGRADERKEMNDLIDLMVEDNK